MKMKLSRDNIKLFYRLYHPLLFYANKELGMIEGINSPEDFKRCPLDETNKLRNKLYEHPHLIKSFACENPFNFSSYELKIVESWENFVKGRFFIFRYLKNYTVFLTEDDPPKAYGVYALNTTFEEMLGPYLPLMVDAVLLPYRDKIIYDGIFSPYSISFGSGIRRRFNDDYQLAKSRFGIITSLPFSEEEIEQNDAEQLKFYLKGKHNREIYEQEIDELIEKDETLWILYHQEMGKVHARGYRKQLREIGLNDIWFAILEGVIVASGKTKNQLEKVLGVVTK